MYGLVGFYFLFVQNYTFSVWLGIYCKTESCLCIDTPCKPGVAHSIPGFTGLSGETINRGPVSVTFAVIGTLNPKLNNQI